MKNKKGKKLVVLGAMAALLTLIGVSGSQTYAKYVENAEVTSQSATVAKWGFTLSANGSNLFSSDYDNTGAALETVGGGVKLSASSYDAKDIVQPGGKGSFEFTLTGQAEVAAQLKLSLANDFVDVYLGDGDEEYHPIKWTFKYQKYTDIEQNTKDGEEQIITNAKDLATLDHDIDALYTLGGSVKFSPKAIVSYKFTLSWAWDFATDGSTGVKDLYTTLDSDILTANVADTYLAILSNKKDSLQYKYETAAPVTGLKDLYTGKHSVVTSFALNINLEQVQEA